MKREKLITFDSKMEKPDFSTKKNQAYILKTKLRGVYDKFPHLLF